MNLVKKNLILSILLVSFSFSLAYPSYLNLQGNVNGLTTGNIEVYVYDSPTGGNLIYNDTFTNAIQNGIYDILLGEGDNNINLSLEYGKVYYLDLTIQGEDIDFNGNERQKFVSSIGTFYIDSNGNVGAYEHGRWTTITDKKNAIVVTQNNHGFIVGNAIYYNGTTYKKALANDTNTLGVFIVSKVIDNNNVELTFSGYIDGLSGLTPGAYYFVSNSTQGEITSTEPSAGYSNPILLALSSTSGIVLPWRASSISTGGGSGSSSLWNESSGVLFPYSTDLNVAIGATTTSAQLEIFNSSGGSLKLSGVPLGVPRIYFEINGDGDEAYIYFNDTSDDFNIGTIQATPFHFKTHGVTRLTIMDTGEVGIGTINPQANLHVMRPNDGQVYFEGDDFVFAMGSSGTTYSNWDYFAVSAENRTLWSKLPINLFSGELKVISNNLTLDTGTTDGEIYLRYIDDGTQVASIGFVQNAVDGDSGLLLDTTESFGIKVSGSQIISVPKGSGKVGVGTINPSYTLDVMGNGYFSDGLTVGIDPTLFSFSSNQYISIANDGEDTFFRTHSGDMSDGWVSYTQGSTAGILYNYGSSDFANGWNYNTLYLFNNHTNGQVRVRTTSGDVLTILNDGKVGIGTTNPQDELTVYGPGNFYIVDPMSSGGTLKVENSERLYANSDGIDWITLEFYDTALSRTDGVIQMSWEDSPDTLRMYSRGAIFLGTDVSSMWSSINGKKGLYISTDGKVGIGTTNPQVFLHVYSNLGDENMLRLQDTDGTCDHNPESGSEVVSCTSDIRLKTNIKPAAPVLDYLMGIPIKDYTIISSGKNMTGVIAQEILDKYSELVSINEDGYYMVSEINSWKLVKAIQELKQENDILKKELCERDNSYSWCS